MGLLSDLIGGYTRAGLVQGQIFVPVSSTQFKTVSTLLHNPKKKKKVVIILDSDYKKSPAT